MSSKLMTGGAPGTATYLVILSEDGRAWNGAGLETIDETHWASYVVALPQVGRSGYFAASVPATLPRGWYHAMFHLQQGASPDMADPVGDDWRFEWHGAKYAGDLHAVTDYEEPVPTANTPQSHGDCLNAARAIGFGKWVIVGTTLTLYAADGVTVVRAFTLDNALAPMRRE